MLDLGLGVGVREALKYIKGNHRRSGQQVPGCICQEKGRTVPHAVELDNMTGGRLKYLLQLFKAERERHVGDIMQRFLRP